MFSLHKCMADSLQNVWKYVSLHIIYRQTRFQDLYFVSNLTGNIMRYNIND